MMWRSISLFDLVANPSLPLLAVQCVFSVESDLIRILQLDGASSALAMFKHDDDMPRPGSTLSRKKYPGQKSASTFLSLSTVHSLVKHHVVH